MAHTRSVRQNLRVRPGVVNLAGYDTAATPLAPGGKAKTTAALADPPGTSLEEWQERLTASAAEGLSPRSVLLVLQGIDTAGKGGVVKHVVGQLQPEAVRITAFKRPTPTELAHHYLWRIRRALPAMGQIGVFDRSHYEDVIVPRVHDTLPLATVEARYEEINAFERDLVAGGTTVVKVFLHISYATQRERLLARLDDPTKTWKFSEGDVDERGFWTEYQTAFGAMLEKTDTDVAPWYVVPSDRKWYRNWAVGEILRETFAELDPVYPPPAVDAGAMRKRLQPPY
ncbi:PPK2 family polyphosphate kinase [Jatrophihabitans sp. YIM 134969]